MASILRQLKDSDLEAVHHMIRRDAMADKDIATEVEMRLCKPISGTLSGRINVIHRYRKSGAYQRWLKAWLGERSQMESALAQQANRFELIKDVILDTAGTGIEKVSKALQARALSLAAEANDVEFLEGLAGKGPFANALKLAQATVRDVYRQKLEELKGQLALGVAMDTVVAKVDEIMGLK
jgi:hypothetical protein